MILNARSISSDAVSALHDLVHDRWFDLKELRFDKKLGLVSLRFGDKRKGPFDQSLAVAGVAAVNVKDDAHIGIYDIDRLEIDTRKPSLTLTSGFPLQIVVELLATWEVRTE